MESTNFEPPADDTLYMGLNGSTLFTYADMIESVGADQAPTDESELEMLLWSFDAREVSET